jgi:hypothetical protein
MILSPYLTLFYDSFISINYLKEIINSLHNLLMNMNDNNLMIIKWYQELFNDSNNVKILGSSTSIISSNWNKLYLFINYDNIWSYIFWLLMLIWTLLKWGMRIKILLNNKIITKLIFGTSILNLKLPKKYQKIY